MNISKKLVVLIMSVVTLSLSACSGLTRSDKPAVNTWWLNPYAGMAQVETPKEVQEVSLNVTVVPGLDTDQILTLSRSSKLKPYAGARWVDNLPELGTSLVARTLDASGRFDVQHGLSKGSSGKCILDLEFQKFFASMNSAGETGSVHVSYDAHYQCDSGEPLHFRADSSERVSDERMKVIVAAFQEAMNETMRDLLKELP